MTFASTVGIAGQYSALGQEINGLKAQADGSIKALESLARDGGRDASAAFGAIVDAVTAIGPQVESIRSSLAATRGAANRHFESWAKQNASISDDELKVRSEERRTELSGLVGSIGTSVARAASLNQACVGSLHNLLSPPEEPWRRGEGRTRCLITAPPPLLASRVVSNEILHVRFR